ncbi:MAG: hypothetical protein ACE5IQ_13250 [Candidatus Methylomirabilales bacterium]
MHWKVWFAVLMIVGGVGLAASAASAETREFLIVTNEIKWEAEGGEAPVADRNRGRVKEIERYTFAPGFLVVNQGDKVVLRIHAIKGSKHIIEVPAFHTGETLIRRGQEKAVTFVADKAGVFEFRCNNHKNANKEGPMVGYLYVRGK